MKTKIIGNLVRRVTDEDGSCEVTFKVDNWRYINWLRGLEKKEYAIEIDEMKRKRTLQQNKYLWALIHEIVQNENAQSDDMWEMYCYLLQLANAKCTYISVLESAVEDVKREVRCLQVVGYETRENGTKWANCRIFLGSSKMDTKEMGVLIDKAIEYAENLGIDTAYYKDVLRL